MVRSDQGSELIADSSMMPSQTGHGRLEFSDSRDRNNFRAGVHWQSVQNGQFLSSLALYAPHLPIPLHVSGN